MNKQELIKRDTDTIERAMKNYSGAGAAHFGFIAYATGERQFISGGNSQILGVCLAEAIATLIERTPGLSADFIDAIADTAKAIMEENGGMMQ